MQTEAGRAAARISGTWYGPPTQCWSSQRGISRLRPRPLAAPGLPPDGATRGCAKAGILSKDASHLKPRPLIGGRGCVKSGFCSKIPRWLSVVVPSRPDMSGLPGFRSALRGRRCWPRRGLPGGPESPAGALGVLRGLRALRVACPPAPWPLQLLRGRAAAARCPPPFARLGLRPPARLGAARGPPLAVPPPPLRGGPVVPVVVPAGTGAGDGTPARITAPPLGVGFVAPAGAGLLVKRASKKAPRGALCVP